MMNGDYRPMAFREGNYAAVAAMNATPTSKVGPALVVSGEDPRFEGKFNGHTHMGMLGSTALARLARLASLVALVPQWRQDYPSNRPPTRATAISAMGHKQPPAPQKKPRDLRPKPVSTQLRPRHGNRGRHLTPSLPRSPPG